MQYLTYLTGADSLSQVAPLKINLSTRPHTTHSFAATIFMGLALVAMHAIRLPVQW